MNYKFVNLKGWDDSSQDWYIIGFTHHPFVDEYNYGSALTKFEPDIWNISAKFNYLVPCVMFTEYMNAQAMYEL